MTELFDLPADQEDTTARDRERLELIAKSPLRSTKDQENVDGLALFDAVRSPSLF